MRFPRRQSHHIIASRSHKANGPNTITCLQSGCSRYSRCILMVHSPSSAETSLDLRCAIYMVQCFWLERFERGERSQRQQIEGGPQHGREKDERRETRWVEGATTRSCEISCKRSYEKLRKKHERGYEIIYTRTATIEAIRDKLYERSLREKLYERSYERSDTREATKEATRLYVLCWDVFDWLDRF